MSTKLEKFDDCHKWRCDGLAEGITRDLERVERFDNSFAGRPCKLASSFRRATAFGAFASWMQITFRERFFLSRHLSLVVCSTNYALSKALRSVVRRFGGAAL